MSTITSAIMLCTIISGVPVKLSRLPWVMYSLRCWGSILSRCLHRSYIYICRRHFGSQLSAGNSQNTGTSSHIPYRFPTRSSSCKNSKHITVVGCVPVPKPCRDRGCITSLSSMGSCRVSMKAALSIQCVLDGSTLSKRGPSPSPGRRQLRSQLHLDQGRSSSARQSWP